MFIFHSEALALFIILQLALVDFFEKLLTFKGKLLKY